MKEKREIKSYDHNIISRPNGRSQSRAQCPFCDEVSYVYTWSFWGGGKKCSCGAILSVWGCRKEVADAKTQKTKTPS